MPQAQSIEIKIAMYRLEDTELLALLKDISEKSFHDHKFLKMRILVDLGQMEKIDGGGTPMHHVLRPFIRSIFHSTSLPFTDVEVKAAGVHFRRDRSPQEPRYSNRTMHLKMATIQINYPDHTDYTLITGSFNWTLAGRVTNFENCFILKSTTSNLLPEDPSVAVSAVRRAISQSITAFDDLWAGKLVSIPIHYAPPSQQRRSPSPGRGIPLTTASSSVLPPSLPVGQEASFPQPSFAPVGQPSSPGQSSNWSNDSWAAHYQSPSPPDAGGVSPRRRRLSSPTALEEAVERTEKS
jgi:phosphatidylserine/phosphatidylglycerophosphate/cardiolipin synthase-like enzyme